MTNKGQRILYFEHEDPKVIFRARLLDEINPEFCELLWKHLPFKSMYSHTMASGKVIYMPHRIVAQVKTHTELMTEVSVGTVWMGTMDYKNLTIKYGEATEPLPVSPVAQVLEEDINKLKVIGAETWQSNFITKKQVMVTVRGGDMI